MDPLTISLGALAVAAVPLVLRAFKYVTTKTKTRKDDKVADFVLKNEAAVLAYLAKLLAKREADTKTVERELKRDHRK